MKHFTPAQKFLLFVLLAYTLGLAIGPRVAADAKGGQCYIDRPFFGPFGVSIICDAPAYMNAALKPSSLLKKEATWQSRPGYPFLAYALMLPFKWVHQGILGGLHEQFFLNFAPLLAYLALNLAFLFLAARLATLALFRASVIDAPRHYPCGWRQPFLFVLLLLFFNDVTKAFLWTPHTQMFNIFTPSFALFALIAVARADRPQTTLLPLAFAGGFGTLIYGTFAVTIPALAAGLWLNHALLRPSRLWPALLTLIAAGFVFALPGSLWFGFVWLKTGSFFSLEIEKYRQVVWMADVYTQFGPLKLMAGIWENFRTLAVHATRQSWPLWIVGLMVFGACALRGESLIRIVREEAMLLGAALFVSLTLLLFYSLAGVTVGRVAFSTLVPLITLVAGWARRGLQPGDEGRPAAVGLVLLAALLLYGCYVVAKDGPWA